MAGGSDAAEATTLSCVQCGKPVHLQCPKCMELKLPQEGAAFSVRQQDVITARLWSVHVLPMTYCFKNVDRVKE
ncbi:hypothetical protein GH714_032402 [Hevea brasiliensis]|uniref:Uncharacterized protein n=1 Tax=Hevea brasiliensis TaxID=3981 RepID=A0A6A6MQG3_HEVBR|nr:hypothetical protein GH714_041303 [Hevea brasiliensis]KAF2320982.1 hypothetical protein GH714_032402 [Hevea brasiliensis]